MPSKSNQDWLNSTYGKAVARNPERKALYESSSGEPVAPLYGPEDLAEWNYHEKLGYPGEFPYTRGVQPTMYRGRLWTMRQYAGFGDAEESNRRYKFLLEQGQTGLSVAFDLPTQIGYDSDHPMALGEVGKVGVAISSLEDMEILTDGIPLEQITTSMTINATAPILLALYVAAAKKQDADLAKIGGTIQNDILKEYIARGTYIFPPRPSLRLITDVFAWCKDELPDWNTISISGYHMREAGCTAAQELAFTFGNAIEYVDAAVAVGLEFDEFAPRLAFFWACHSNFLEEVAKFRASRRIWAKIASERYGSKSARSQTLRFHTQTGGATLTAQQPLNNVVRTALQALSAVLGGTQSLHTNSFDEALALPTEASVELALRTQQIIGYESGVSDTIDPLAGSYYIEALTDRVEQETWAYIERIDDIGGALVGIEQGYQQREIQESAYRLQRLAEQKQRIIVGVNQFATDTTVNPEIMRVDPTVEATRVARLAALRKRRDNAAVEQSLTKIRAASRSNENMMPLLIEAVEAYTTVGEICGVLREEWGEYQEVLTI
ncbi:MAG: methylmalonyl-CoA mutase family protein [Chloroflexi bacterium]|nr:methylmalonyl-CoA mutase family protein [Chloroflexota bacterium]MDA1001735.1 methylmalonyl-CoA mutase family protein [Chloroflexota bacterium]